MIEDFKKELYHYLDDFKEWQASLTKSAGEAMLAGTQISVRQVVAELKVDRTEELAEERCRRVLERYPVLTLRDLEYCLLYMGMLANSAKGKNDSNKID